MVFFNVWDEYDDDEATCSGKGNENDCINTILKNPSQQCCFTDYNNEKIWNIQDNDEIFMYFYRGFNRNYEILGHEYIHNNEYQYFCETKKLITKCKNKEYEYRGGECSFSLEEKQIFESENHCLNLFYKSKKIQFSK